MPTEEFPILRRSILGLPFALAACNNGKSLEFGAFRAIRSIALIPPTNPAINPQRYVAKTPHEGGIFNVVNVINSVSGLKEPNDLISVTESVLRDEIPDRARLFTGQLVQELQAQGYMVTVIPTPRMSMLKLFESYQGLNITQDAIMDVVLVAGITDSATATYQPAVAARLKVTARESGAVKLDQVWGYGNRVGMGIALSGENHLQEAPAKYQFSPMELYAHPRLAAEGLRTGIGFVAHQIAEAMRQ